MADDLTNTTFPSDNIDENRQHRESNPNDAQNLSNEDHSKGGKASHQKGTEHKSTNEEQSK